MSSEEMQSMMKTLWELNGVMGSFKTHQGIHDDDDDRMTSLEYLNPIVSRLYEAIRIIKNYVNSGRKERFLNGVKFDKSLRLTLKSIDDATKLFSIALISNQQTIIREVNKYVHTIVDDVKEVQAAQVNAKQGGICFYYFHRFDDQDESRRKAKGTAAATRPEEHIGVTATAALVDQVFRHFYRKDQRIATYVSDYIKTEPKNRASLEETARLIIKHAHEWDEDEGAITATEQLTIHYFLDGVDEEKGGDVATTIIDILHGLEKHLPVNQKIWISSRRTSTLEPWLAEYAVINMDEYGTADVEGFLIRGILKVNENWQRNKAAEGKLISDWALQKIQATAKGNFLFARMTIDWLIDGVYTIHDVTAFIESRVPDQFAEMYKRIFRQYQEEQHQYVRGEVDRCLTSLLGPKHFMTGMKERYQSFMLTCESFECDISKQFFIADTVSASGSQLLVMSSPSKTSADVSLETWDLESPNAPQCTCRITSANVDVKSDAARPIGFSHPIAKFLFENRDYDARHILDQQKALKKYEPISIDVETRNSRKTTNLEKGSDRGEDGNEHSDHSDDDFSNSASEACSEGSTDFESDASESEMHNSDTEWVESSKEEKDEQGFDPDPVDDEGRLGAPGTQGRKPVSRPQQLTGIEPEHWEDPLRKKRDSRSTYPGIPCLVRDPNDRLISSIAVYDGSVEEDVRIFHYEHKSPVTSGGEVLFADYAEKTYFIRATMPTTSNTRHICMKLRFSECGSYLHIASVEGRLLNSKIASASPSNEDDAKKPEVMLSVFLTTHRLSSRKTTRSSPRLVHRAKLTIGQFTGLSLAKLPFTFAWTPEHLHFTLSGVQLNVFRIDLFRQPGSISTASVATPRLSVVLPLSATGRQVYYLPPSRKGKSDGGRARGIVLMSSYCAGNQPVELGHRSGGAANRGVGNSTHYMLYDYMCPPVGFFVDEESDLGGWDLVQNDGKVDDSLGMTATSGEEERFRNGKLAKKNQAFTWRDDIDLEGICDYCNRPPSFQ
ncbi:zinc finger protein [Colletotrichum kahawae]|uniref:Zinc finger protein n=1 Tax=Colletotrichum kahawae TaxID=34407 RepID=A0AAE0D6V7_COLKA|nr:zinc finger protein [Colletotrichum kahawae]